MNSYKDLMAEIADLEKERDQAREQREEIREALKAELDASYDEIIRLQEENDTLREEIRRLASLVTLPPWREDEDHETHSLRLAVEDAR